ncbi:MAG TPA: hypothetical protein V6C81_05100 [Planktothrix sp.]|jgi:hypothetical protein
MKRAFIAPLLGLAMVAASLPSPAAPLMLNGAVAQAHVNALTNDIEWNTSLYNAEMEARRTGKMIFWVHMLGDMKGAT